METKIKKINYMNQTGRYQTSYGVIANGKRYEFSEEELRDFLKGVEDGRGK